MHQNHYFLRALVNELNPVLRHQTLLQCFSQNKDEIVLVFTHKNQDHFYLKADLSEGRGILSFPQDFKRARKNTIDLFSEVINCKVKDLRVHLNERSFEVIFEEEIILVFKLFGRWSNVILFHGEQPQTLFKKASVKDLTIRRSELNRQLDQSQAAFVGSGADIKSVFPTFGPLVLRYLEDHHYPSQSIEGKWEMISGVLSSLNHPSFYIVQYEGAIRLSLLRIGEVIEEHSSPIQAVNAYQRHFFNVNLLEQEKASLINAKRKKLMRLNSYITKLTAKEHELSHRQYHQIGDIIMANLHAILPQQSETTLFNFYSNEEISIKLNPRLSAQKNAERYYQKSKNQGIELSKAKENLSAKKNELAYLQDEITQIENIDQLKELRKKYPSGASHPGKKQDPALPYHQFEIDGFVVLVGKNAKLNDRLTLNFAHKDDLWFHAKDVAGSHVVLKLIPGKNFPNPVIEKTAQLAAWFSKGRNYPLCPVIYTSKKFVRKPKGFLAGMVKVEHEKVILVEPKRLTHN